MRESGSLYKDDTSVFLFIDEKKEMDTSPPTMSDDFVLEAEAPYGQDPIASWVRGSEGLNRPPHPYGCIVCAH